MLGAGLGMNHLLLPLHISSSHGLPISAGTVLNTMWFTIMCKGLIKVIKGEGKEPDDGPDTDKAAVHKDQKDSAKVLKNGANNTPAKESKKKK